MRSNMLAGAEPVTVMSVAKASRSSARFDPMYLVVRCLVRPLVNQWRRRRLRLRCRALPWGEGAVHRR